MASKSSKGSRPSKNGSPFWHHWLLIAAIIISWSLELGAQQIFPAWFTQLPTAERGQVFVCGYVARYTKPERAREAAIDQAIRALAQYQSMHLKFDLLEMSDGRLQVTKPIFEKGFNTGALEYLANNITVLDSLSTEEGYFVLVAYPRTERKGDYHQICTEWGKPPEWIDQLPREKGYIFGLGQVARYTHWVRAWRDADDYARFDLVKSLKLETESTSTEERHNRTTKTTVLRRQTVDYQLVKAQIIARWYDRKRDTYYSLCRAPKP